MTNMIERGVMIESRGLGMSQESHGTVNRLYRISARVKIAVEEEERKALRGLTTIAPGLATRRIYFVGFWGMGRWIRTVSS